MHKPSWMRRSVPWLLIGLSLSLAPGCALLTSRKPLYVVSVPTLQIAPMRDKCPWRDPNGVPDEWIDADCVMLLGEDYDALVRELKAACIHNGQTDCQQDVR